MAEERNALIAKIYPKLRSYCRERYGIDFLVRYHPRSLRLLHEENNFYTPYHAVLPDC